jgi:hypothetical protein
VSQQSFEGIYLIGQFNWFRTGCWVFVHQGEAAILDMPPTGLTGPSPASAVGLDLIYTQANVVPACRKTSNSKKHLLSRLALLPDHIHSVLGIATDESPVEVALSYMNNIAFVYEMRDILIKSCFIGTFGVYDLGAIAPHAWLPRTGGRTSQVYKCPLIPLVG